MRYSPLIDSFACMPQRSQKAYVKKHAVKKAWEMWSYSKDLARAHLSTAFHISRLKFKEDIRCRHCGSDCSLEASRAVKWYSITAQQMYCTTVSLHYKCYCIIWLHDSLLFTSPYNAKYIQESGWISSFLIWVTWISRSEIAVMIMLIM